MTLFQEYEEGYRSAGFYQQGLNFSCIYNTLINDIIFIFSLCIAPFPPTRVRGFCDVIVWPLLAQPGGVVFSYDVHLFIPGTEQSTIVNLGKTEFFIVDDQNIPEPKTSVLIQV